MSSFTSGPVFVRLLHLLKSATASHPDAKDVAESQNKNIIIHHTTTNENDRCHNSSPNIAIRSIPKFASIFELNTTDNIAKIVAKIGHHSIEPNIPKSM